MKQYELPIDFFPKMVKYAKASPTLLTLDNVDTRIIYKEDMPKFNTIAIEPPKDFLDRFLRSCHVRI